MPVDGVFELHQAYVSADPGYSGRVTVADPVRQEGVDDRQQRIVRDRPHAEHRVRRSRCDAARPLSRRPATGRDRRFSTKRIYETVNNGVYRTGFAKAQETYEEACNKLFDTLDWLDDVLGERRYLCGERLTEADWRLYPTLIRFDCVYHGPLQVQQAAHRRLPEPVELPARALPTPRDRRADRHPGHQAGLLRRHEAHQPDRHRAAGAGYRPPPAARPGQAAEGGLTVTSGRAGIRRSSPCGRPRSPAFPAG